MKVKVPLALTILSCAMIVNIAHAQKAYLYVAHAISGRALSASTNPEYPLDLSLNGVCVAKGISYGEIRGPISGPAGPTVVQFSIANYLLPCGGTPVYVAAPPLTAGTTYYGVLTLDASNHSLGLLFNADLSAVAAGASRVVVINATQDDLTGSFSGLPGVYFPLPAASLQTFVPANGLYTVSVLDSGHNLLTGPVNVTFESGNAYVYVVGGSAATNVQWFGPAVIRGLY
jgi:Domain of unknown function (DUF4397)